MADRKQRHVWLRALGADDMPEEITLDDGTYRRVKTYKHDFFAATGLYEGPSGRVILKIGRVQSLFGLPTVWLGRWLADRERRLYDAVEDLQGVPRCMGGWDRTGFVHAFVPGHPLQRKEAVNDDFFRRLESLIATIHERDIAYADLEKRENILVGDDGLPYLIDFQISWYWSAGPSGRSVRWMLNGLGRLILRRLQQADRYHLLKHWRRHRPDQLSEAQLQASYRVGFWIRLHRTFIRPLTLLRRAVLKMLTGRSRSEKQDGPEYMNTP